MWEIVGEGLFFLLIGVLLFGGLVLAVVNLPGVWVIWLGILITGLVKGFGIIPVWFVVLTFIFAVIVSIIDNFIIAAAAKKYGGGKWGMIGGVLGAIFGFVLLNFPGLLIGPFLGAFILEYAIAKKEKSEAIKAGMGSFIGVIISIALKVALCFGMIIAFILIWAF